MLGIFKTSFPLKMGFIIDTCSSDPALAFDMIPPSATSTRPAARARVVVTTENPVEKSSNKKR